MGQRFYAILRPLWSSFTLILLKIKKEEELSGILLRFGVLMLWKDTWYNKNFKQIIRIYEIIIYRINYNSTKRTMGKKSFLNLRWHNKSVLFATIKTSQRDCILIWGSFDFHFWSSRSCLVELSNYKISFFIKTKFHDKHFT